MKDDKITAMWEEDGDLMRIRNFFNSIKPDDSLKDRIKEKTLSKLSSPETPPVTLLAEPLRPNDNSGGEKGKGKILKFIKNKKSVLKIVSAAAVVVLAVGLGTSGLLMGGSNASKGGGFNLLSGSAKSAEQATDSAAPESPRVMMNGTAFDMGRDEGEFMAASEDGAAGKSIMPPVAPPMNGAPMEEGVIKQKLIYTMNVTLKANNVVEAMEAIQNKVKAIGGYVVDSSINNDQYQTTAYITVKVPVKEFDGFKGGLDEFGTVVNQHLSTSDVSKEYFDTETRLRSLEAQEQRYLDILQKANTIEDILRIQDSLNNVRMQIESLQGQLKYWDNRVDYSEIHLNIYPVQSDLTVTDPWQPVSVKNTIIAAKNAIIKTVSFLWNAVNYLVVFIGYALPVIILLGIIWAVWFVVRKKRKNKQQ